jgi:hypothetical protein
MDDIEYLGRGVSGQLHDRCGDVLALRCHGLPELCTPAELAAVLELPLPRLRWLAYHSDVVTRPHYVCRMIPKRSGGERLLSVPRACLRQVQNRIREMILDRLAVEEPAQGFVKGRNVLTNALPHSGQRLVLRMDLADFFPSIGFGRVRSVFRRAGYSPAVASILALLCTECPRVSEESAAGRVWRATGPRGLPQGACTSPALSNLVCRHLDRRLQGLAASLHVRYTRYADDLTFSAGRHLEPKIGWLLTRVREIVESEGFRIREEKTRVQRRNVAQRVTGLVVNDRPGVPRAEVRRLRAILHRAATEGLESQNREGRQNFQAWLLGRIAWIHLSRPAAAAALRKTYREVLRQRPEYGPCVSSITGPRSTCDLTGRLSEH